MRAFVIDNSQRYTHQWVTSAQSQGAFRVFCFWVASGGNVTKECKWEFDEQFPLWWSLSMGILSTSRLIESLRTPHAHMASIWLEPRVAILPRDISRGIKKMSFQMHQNVFSNHLSPSVCRCLWPPAILLRAADDVWKWYRNLLFARNRQPFQPKRLASFFAFRGIFTVCILVSPSFISLYACPVNSSVRPEGPLYYYYLCRKKTPELLLTSEQSH